MWKKLFGNKQPKSSGTIQNNDGLDPAKIPQHVAIIMDGNGRWAQKRGLPRTMGHRAGVESLKKIVKTASDIGVKVLTAYAFSTENWNRPSDEVSFLMRLFIEALENEIANLQSNNVLIRFSGETGVLAPELQTTIAKATQRTKDNTGLVLNLAINYGSRAEITRAVKLIAQDVIDGQIKMEDISDQTIARNLYTADLPDPDLLIRPSGDLRISNFLLWQLAYTEFWFTTTNWPDFTSELFIQAVRDFQHRERRFGGLKKSK
ncbi:MAG: uppS [Firmicutes bacterium]|nr:uppS [Bacillota bacterium]